MVRTRDAPDGALRQDVATQPLLGFLPVHHVPPGGDVIGSAVLVFEIVGVFPHIQANTGYLPSEMGLS